MMVRSCINPLLDVDLRLHTSAIGADLIFKNQANGTSEKPTGQFVNDLLRTEFHKCVFALLYPL
jgi:hypothetical protein